MKRTIPDLQLYSYYLRKDALPAAFISDYHSNHEVYLPSKNFETFFSFSSFWNKLNEFMRVKEPVVKILNVEDPSLPGLSGYLRHRRNLLGICRKLQANDISRTYLVSIIYSTNDYFLATGRLLGHIMVSSEAHCEVRS